MYCKRRSKFALVLRRLSKLIQWNRNCTQFWIVPAKAKHSLISPFNIQCVSNRTKMIDTHEQQMVSLFSASPNHVHICSSPTLYYVYYDMVDITCFCESSSNQCKNMKCLKLVQFDAPCLCKAYHTRPQIRFTHFGLQLKYALSCTTPAGTKKHFVIIIISVDLRALTSKILYPAQKQ